MYRACTKALNFHSLRDVRESKWTGVLFRQTRPLKPLPKLVNSTHAWSIWERLRSIPRRIRDKIVEGHKAGKGYENLSKELGLPVSTIGSISRKWKAYGTTVNHPRPGQPFKVSSRAEARLVRTVKADPRITRRELQEI
ncbi:hypothetical protein NFI96_013464 [Prochilodus magdalenae]|nr:hypothetical protein NFI96_013464 [Prochilodus magdalenae]